VPSPAFAQSSGSFNFNYDETACTDIGGQLGGGTEHTLLKTTMKVSSLLFAWVPVASASVQPTDVNAADFPTTPTITNPFFPLSVGMKFVYSGTKGGVPTVMRCAS
jgi:hypothetical protein